jgi:hypothetical protein
VAIVALTTYEELKTSIANFLARDELTAFIPDFITLFECDAARRLKVRPQATTTTLTPSSGVATLPTDYLGYQRVTWTGSPIQGLEYVAPALYAGYLESGSGTPLVFTIEGTSLKVAPSSDTDITFSYFQRTPAVSGSLAWLFDNHVDAYLAGSLAQAAAFNKGFDVAGTWLARCDQIFRDIQSLDFNERQGMAVRTMGLTP